MEIRTSEESPTVRYAIRQPILAADETVIGYKLVFRTDLASHFSASPAEVIAGTVDMSSLLGLDILCDRRLAFIGCDRKVLEERFLAFLPADRVVAEIDRRVEADDTVLEACCALKNAGYRIALDAFTVDDPRQAIAHLADYLKVDLSGRNWEAVPNAMGPDHWRHANLVATGVDSREQFEWARRAGFQFFQGHFFRKPETLRTRSAPLNHAVYLRLLREVTKPELAREAIEDLIKSDPTLYFRLLRFLNSAAYGSRGEVQTVRQAFLLMGDEELRRWCRLAGIFQMSRGRPTELLLFALARARFAELLGERVQCHQADLFLLGLLSQMDAILEIPMSAVIEGLPLDNDSSQLLLEHQGRIQPVFELVMAVETGRWQNVLESCSELGVPEEFVACCYSSALAWAQSLAASA